MRKRVNKEDSNNSLIYETLIDIDIKHDTDIDTLETSKKIIRMEVIGCNHLCQYRVGVEQWTPPIWSASAPKFWFIVILNNKESPTPTNNVVKI